MAKTQELQVELYGYGRRMTAEEIRDMGGGAVTLAAMNKHRLLAIGQRTYQFVRRCQKNPELWAKIQARAAELDRLEAEAHEQMEDPG